MLLLLAQLLRSQSRSLAGQVLWVQRLAFAAAIGFLLLIPLQTNAGLKLLGQIREQLSRFTPGRRPSGPVDADWFESLRDGDDAPSDEAPGSSRQDKRPK